jgi:hypothetical protein
VADKRNVLTNEHKRIVMAAERDLERADGDFCDFDGEPWPCHTFDALDRQGGLAAADRGAVQSPDQMITGREFVVEYRDVPRTEWCRYGTYPRPEKARETVDRLIERMRPQGADFRIIEVATTRTYRTVENRMFCQEAADA